MATSFQAAKAARLEETGRETFAPVDESLFLSQGGGSRKPVWRRNQHGDLIRVLPGEEEPGFFERKTVPPTGDYTLRFQGMEEPSEELNKFHNPNDERSQMYVLKAWMEFEIIDGPLKGQWFSNKWTWPRALKKPRQGNIATMAEFAINLLGEEPPDHFDRRDLIGMEFKGRVKNKSERYSALATDEVHPLDGEVVAGITLDQAGLLEKMAKDLWKTRIAAKQKLLVLLDHEYEVDTLDALTYEQADQLINWMDTKPDEVKDVVMTLEATDENAYPEVPQ